MKDCSKDAKDITKFKSLQILHKIRIINLMYKKQCIIKN